MQKLFKEVGSLDKRCYDEFALTEDILMEHAAEGMASFIRKNFKKNSTVLVLCGSGNNGADGIALSRLLHLDYDVYLLHAKEPKSPMALLQKTRASKIGVKTVDDVLDAHIIVDALVGTGFRGEFDERLSNIIQKANDSKAFKIACDVPSGYRFRADVTLTMGGLKRDMFLDAHKDFTGNIEVLNLGLSREVYEGETSWFVLDMQDMKLPYREHKNSHKGTFGHLAVALGEKSGASVISSLSALRFGSGLVTLVGFENITLPHSLMYSHEVPKNATALAVGMGLGDEFSDVELEKFLDNSLPMVADADILKTKTLKELLKRENIVLTPHPKEFAHILKTLNLAEVSVEELQKNRFEYVELFTQHYPNTVLLLKGANVIIAKNKEFYINPHGKASLAKGGSGDVLSGLVGALLAQGCLALESAINASLAHAKLSMLYKGADFSLTPDDLIEQIGSL